MKRYLIILMLSLFTTGILPARADYIATQNFVIDVDTTMTVVTSGTLTTPINGMTGNLDTPLNLNFNISVNQDTNDIRLKAIVTDSTAGQHSGFYCTGSSAVSSQAMYMVLAEPDVEAAGIANCEQAVSTVADNPCAIAYPGTVAIDNGGTVQYVENSGNGYFNVNVAMGETNLSVNLSTTVKAGTYDAYVANDCAENYQVEVFLDNIPG